MIKELYQTKLQEVSLNVTDSQIDALRTKNITKSGCRVYDHGFFGIAGNLGEPKGETWNQARENLARKLPCPWGPGTNGQRHCRLGGEMTADQFLAQAEGLLASLRQDFPQFQFSNKLNWVEREVCLKNDVGLDYLYRDAVVEISLLVRSLDSANIFDTALSGVYRTFSPEQFLAEARQILEAHLHPIAMPEQEKMAALFSPYEFQRAGEQGLSGQKLARNASPLSGKVGQQLFSPAFTLQVDRSADNELEPFFDGEGATLPADTMPLIEHGVLRRGFSDKKCAWTYGVENTASGEGEYDDVPGLTMPPLSVAHTGKTLAEILDGRPALYMMTSGGDVTAGGSYASPVQVAYLYQDGKLLGRLPEFGIRGMLTDIFGKDYLGSAIDRPFDNSRPCVAEFTLVR